MAAAPDTGTEVKSVQVEVDAPEGCANADDFFVSLRSRTNLVRQATGDEPHTTLQVRLLETRRYVLGELRMVGDRGGTDTRRVQGANCGDVVQALSLAAAVALDPSVLLPPTVTVPAPATTVPADTPPPIPQPVTSSVDTPNATDAPTSRVSPSGPRFEIGAAGAGSALLSSGVSLGMSVFGRWTLGRSGAFRPTVGMAVTYLRSDILQSPGAAQATMTGLALTMCGTGWGGSLITAKPCGLVMAGMLEVSGHQAIRTTSVALLWLSAGAVVRMTVLLGRGLSLDLEAGVSVPFVRREFYTTVPSHVVEKTPAISPVAALGLAYGF
jgi:hypothetical protein